MGNISGKKELQTPENSTLDDTFLKISGTKDHILRNDLQRAWKSQIDKYLYSLIESYLFSEGRTKLNNQSFKQFYYDLGKEDAVKKVKVVTKMLNMRYPISQEKLVQFVTSILHSILVILEIKSPKRFFSWNSKIHEKEKKKHFLCEYATFFISKLPSAEKNSFYEEDVAYLVNDINNFLTILISKLYDTENKDFYASVLPKWKNGLSDKDSHLDDFSVLNIFYVMFLNSYLPCDLQNEWRLLFSSARHGESFARMSTEILNQGPTVLIIEDKRHYIFGGFASKDWSFGPTFFGDSRCFLFSLAPKMNIYPPTNFNDNYQYMNVGQQTMPNGLGMGGRLEYFAVWLNADFGSGYCSESCTTFRNYKQMSGTKEFEVKNVEIWGVGKPPPSPEETGERSVLNSNLEAKALLEYSGKVSYSEGLRETDND